MAPGSGTGENGVCAATCALLEMFLGTPDANFLETGDATV